MSMRGAPGTSQAATHQRLVERLVGDVRPVRPLWSPGRRLAVWLAAGAALVFAMALLRGRPDLALRLGEPLFLLNVAVLLAGALWLARLALRAAVPGGEPRPADLALAALVLVLPVVLLAGQPAESVLDGRTFVRAGIGCMLGTLAVGLVPWLALFVAVARGATLDAMTAGGLAGGAALLLATATLRTGCVLDGRYHHLVWHLLPVIVGAGVSAMVGAAWLARWRSRVGTPL